VNCGTSKEEILEGLEKVLHTEQKKITNPYEGKNTTADILQVLKTYPLEKLIQKSFYNMK
jgi:UDP-N-acetylglucosamine 2-epimerase (non-hydrolysing)/GDP/UDP-N,N'-diacetylbacillosamine 2-epimerase (hydrolysing)